MELSYTKLKTAGLCLFHFRMRYVEHRKGSGGGFAPMGQEKIIHRTLRVYHEFAEMTGEVDEISLLHAYDRFMTKEHTDLSVRDTPEYAEGVAILKQYRTRENGLKRVPAYHEKEIVIPFGEHTLTGVVDRIDYDEGGTVAIRDYKLNKILPDGNSAVGNRQLQLYALLVKYGLHLDVSTVSLYYLRHAEEHTLRIKPAHLAQFSSWLEEIVAEIERATLQRDWQPTEGAACAYCPYKDICPAKTGKPEPLQWIARQNAMAFDE